MADLIDLPEGIEILKRVNDDKIFVTNSVLNYYQRKMSVLTIDQVRRLGHHCFTIEQLEEAKLTLLKLWRWKNRTPSTTNQYIIKNLGPRRKVRLTCSVLARDIIEFLEIEDGNLNVVFLTLKCEELPAKIHESQAMQDVYVMLHRTEDDYLRVTEEVRENSIDIDSNSQAVKALQKQMADSFEMVMTTLLKMQEQQATNPILSSTVALDSTFNVPVSNGSPLPINDVRLPTPDSDARSTSPSSMVGVSTNEISRGVSNVMQTIQMEGVGSVEESGGVNTAQMPLVNSASNRSLGLDDISDAEEGEIEDFEENDFVAPRHTYAGVTSHHGGLTSSHNRAHPPLHNAQLPIGHQ